MRISRKIATIALSVAMLATQVVPVYASNIEPGTRTPGDANILGYNFEKVVVPTTLKIAINPSGYPVVKSYEKATAYAANTIYYTEDDYTYTKAGTQPDSTTDFTATDYYKGVKVQDHVVSLNYGIVNKSTRDKVVQVDFALSYTPNTSDTTLKPIQFVDAAAKAAKKDAGNANGAETGELKMYLAVAPSTAAPKVNAYKEATWNAGTVQYYSYDSGTTKYSAETKPGAETDFDALMADPDTMLFEKEANGTINKYIRGKELADAIMTASTEGNSVFVSTVDGAGKAQMAFSLPKGTWTPKTGVDIDFTTTQDNIGTMLDLTAVPGTAAFTIVGEVNELADWTLANTKAIRITPTYTISDATGLETAVDVANCYNQVKIQKAPSAVATQNTIDATAKTATITVDLGLGDLAATTVAKVVSKESGEDWLGAGALTYSNGTITFIKQSDVQLLIDNAAYRAFEIEFDDATHTKVDVTLGLKP